MSVQAPIARVQPVKSIAILRRISQLQIARVTGVSAMYVSRCFNGLVEPRSDFAAAVAAFMAMDEAQLFRPERQPVSPLAGTRKRRARK